MTNTKDIILKLKEVKEEKGLSINDILKMVEANNEFVSKTTITRVFADGSEENSFRYEETLRPIANALLDIDTIEETDNSDIQAMKTLLKYKMDAIQDLERQLEEKDAAFNREKIVLIDKFETERKLYNDRIEFLLSQIDLKDKRMDQLLEAVFQKDLQNKQLMEKFFDCHCCDKRE